MKPLRRDYPLEMLLALIGLRRSTYYYHDKAEHADGQALERIEIRRICVESDRRYGYRRVAQVLRRTTGLAISDKTVLKVMRQEGLLCTRRRCRKYRSYAGQVGKTAPNLLHRDFRSDKPTKKLVTDVTEFKIAGARLYLSPVIDLHNDEVVAYSISRSPNMNMVQRMLAGLEGRLDGKAVLHSDRGWQYQMPVYTATLKRMGMIQSMSRKGNCLDNAKAENFFSMVKTELYYDWAGGTIEDFEDALEMYIRWYNNDRIKMRLEGCSPVEYRLSRAA